MPLVISSVRKSLLPMVTAVIMCDQCGQIASLQFPDESTARADYASSGWIIVTEDRKTVAQCLMCRG